MRLWLNWLKNLLDVILSYSYVVGRVNLELSWISGVQFHTQIIMNFYSGDFNFPNLILVLCFEFLYSHRNFLMWTT